MALHIAGGNTSFFFWSNDLLFSFLILDSLIVYKYVLPADCNFEWKHLSFEHIWRSS